jgi:hypothetical protein
MGFDASNAFKYSTDFVLAYASIVGVSPYEAYLVEITNDQIAFNDTSSGRVVSSTRILLADGYRSYAAGDGYLDALIVQEYGQQLVLSNGQLTTNILLLGPLVFPYTENGFSGGFDSTLFQPAIASNNNIQIYVQIQGPGLSPKKNFFEVKEIRLVDMSGISYLAVLSASDRTVA